MILEVVTNMNSMCIHVLVSEDNISISTILQEEQMETCFDTSPFINHAWLKTV